MTISCIECGDVTFDAMEQPMALPIPIDRGTPGAGPQREYSRRVAKREAQIEQRWGRLASMVKLMSDEPQSTTAWRKGAEGERRLAAHLERELGDATVILHSRCVPRSTADLDHLVIASSGVWVVDAKNYKGRVERREMGSRRTPDPRLFVSGRDKTGLASGLHRQVNAVRSVLDTMTLSTAPIHPNLLFTDSDWGLFGKPFEINGVRVLWAKRLCQLIQGPGPWDRATIDAVAQKLSAALPAKSS